MLANGTWDLIRRLTLNLLTTTIVAPPSNASKWQMGFNSAFKGLKYNRNTGLFKMIVGVLTTCHTQYTADSSICIFYLIEQCSNFLLHNFQVLNMCTLCDSKNLKRKSSSFQTVCNMSAVMVSVLVNCAPSVETHNYCTPHIIKENIENFLIHRFNCIFLTQVYCV
jgi:hypothetical protein